MSEENKVRDAADAVKGIVEAVPVYQDMMQPAAREVGLALQTVAKAIHIVVAPIGALVWGYEQVKEFLSTRVAEKLKDVPTERIVTPEPHVFCPALEALRYTGHQEVLRELFANLLATSLDSATAQHAHPAFVELIKSMSPDEARIMTSLNPNTDIPVVELRAYEKDTSIYVVAVRRLSIIQHEAGCQSPELAAIYLDNLERLGLIESLGGDVLGAPAIAEEGAYDELEASPMVASVRKDVEKAGKTLELNRSFLRLTDLGTQFYKACVNRKVAVSGSVPH